VASSSIYEYILVDYHSIKEYISYNLGFKSEMKISCGYRIVHYTALSQSYVTYVKVACGNIKSASWAAPDHHLKSRNCVLLTFYPIPFCLLIEHVGFCSYSIILLLLAGQVRCLRACNNLIAERILITLQQVLSLFGMVGGLLVAAFGWFQISQLGILFMPNFGKTVLSHITYFSSPSRG